MHKDSDIFGAAVAFEGGLVVLAIVLGIWMDPRPQDYIRWDADGLMWGLTATVPMLVMFTLLRRLPIEPLRKLKQLVDETLVHLFRSCTVLQFAVISLLAGLGEELLFRGAMQPWLSSHTGPVVAIAITSALFGLLHAISLAYAVTAALISVYLGWLMVATDNLLPSIIAHALYDFVVLVYLARRPEKRVEAAAADVDSAG